MKKYNIDTTQDELISFAKCFNEMLKSILKKGYIARASIGLIISDGELINELKEKLEKELKK
ncbi:hypothetical protein [Helicobacter cetorum]|uniref:hypothetical protein n=1 Tax=Helicobacter cetorum TaxID=138563 RepID=UPI000CF160F0|nr:hypothetical protein [Helicobacter cetorum]